MNPQISSVSKSQYNVDGQLPVLLAMSSIAMSPVNELPTFFDFLHFKKIEKIIFFNQAYDSFDCELIVSNCIRINLTVSP